MRLLLAAMEADGPWRWRWLLSDAQTGNPVADHEVRLDPASIDVARFADLYGYVNSYAAPGRRVRDGARQVAAAGRWAGRELLGESVGAAIVAESPVTMLVRVPAALDTVLLWPLELAHAGGKALAARGDVALVYDIAPDAPARKRAEPGAALRILAVFSQPTETGMLALRRERYALSRLIRRIAARENAAVELRVVQYGVTRERLREIADDGDGWDVLHLSGHGAGGAFLLEKADGSPDLVPAADLVELLSPVRARVRLAVVSACESAADATAETYRLLGLTEQAQALAGASAGPGTLASGQPAARPGGGTQLATAIPGLARALVRRLGCAVVGMRYPVTDEFAIAFGDVLYEQLLSRRQPADVAVARAVAAAAGTVASAARPAVSLATPGTFGAQAAGLRLPVPRGRPRIDPVAQRMAYFPDEPARFVGRASAMARASAVLAPGSGRTGVLLHGMAGAGKTACALELAYRHRDAFAALAFWQAPTRDDEWASALPDLANRLDIQLADYGFTMASHIGTVQHLDAFLPRLRDAMAEAGVLLVLDNLETLVTPDGGWRDPRWEKLVTALASHDGESRLILTSRIAPAGLGAASGTPGLAAGLTPRPATGQLVTLPVHALSLGESVVLARELANLRALLHEDAGPLRDDAAAGPEPETDGPLDDDAETEADRERVRRVLRVVQGHPKLMELADAAAADRDRLDAQLAAAETAGSGLDAFFRGGASTLEPQQFLDALAGWTTGTLEALPADARLMAEFMACLEDSDRDSDVVGANWPGLWERLGRAGDAPADAPLLDLLAARALAEAEPVAAPADGEAEDAAAEDAAANEPELVAYRVHPGVAAAIMAAADPGMRDAVDAELALFWVTIADQALEREDVEDTGQLVLAGLAAAPYLLRIGAWDTARTLLEYVIRREGSPGTVQAAQAALRRVTAAIGTPVDGGGPASEARNAAPDEAERALRAELAAAEAAGDYLTAFPAAEDLVHLLRNSGRLAEALAQAGALADYAHRAGAGPWTLLGAQAPRLQVLRQKGEHTRVLAEVAELRTEMAALPVRSAAEEATPPWQVREAILGAGLASAYGMGDWGQCLDLNAEIAASVRGRGAGEHVVSQVRFNDAGPLMKLGRAAEAERLLAECQRVFESHADTASLATVLNTRAALEAALGRWRAAVDLGRSALRLSYAQPEPSVIAIGHHNLANYLAELGEDPTAQRAHRLAAALIRRLAAVAGDFADPEHDLMTEMRADDGAEKLPSTVAGMVLVAEKTDGVHLGDVIATLQPDARAVADTLAEILSSATNLGTRLDELDMALLPLVEPVIDDIVSTCRSGQEPTADLLAAFDEMAADPPGAALGGAVRRILAGERGGALLDGLDSFGIAVITETLARLASSPGRGYGT